MERLGVLKLFGREFKLWQTRRGIKFFKMRKQKYTVNDISNAYRKLKSYVYYDNFSTLLRQRLSEFESKKYFESDLENLCDALNNYDGSVVPELIANKIKEIKIEVYPKSFFKAPKYDEEFVISNKFTSSEYLINKVSYLVDAPIEIHLISVLWIQEEGVYLEKDEYLKRYSYAYKIITKQETGEVVEGLRLFYRYFDQYQKWRDTGVKVAKRLLDEGTDTVIVSLDIRNYYHSIKLDFSVLKEEVNKYNKNAKLTSLIEVVYNTYSSKFHKRRNMPFVPIGLLSSGVIANWFLKEFDRKVVEQLSPAYYGRYVDDILIVLSNTALPNSQYPAKDFLDAFFCKRGILKFIDKEKAYRISGTKYNSLFIQPTKISVFEFKGNGPKAVLENFKKNIDKNSSAFWFLPDDEEASKEFDESAYELTYTDSLNRLRSLQSIKESKYGASIFFAKKIKISLLSDKKKDEKTTLQILSFFKGRLGLDFYGLWEKVVTYFIINGQLNDFWKFYKMIHADINSIEPGPEFVDEAKDSVNLLKRTLIRYLNVSCSLPFALAPDVLNNSLLKKRFRGISDNKDILANDIIGKFSTLIKYFRRSNLIRHQYVTTPLINFTKYCTDNNCSYIPRGFPKKLKTSGFSLDAELMKYSPRYVHLYEFSVFEINKAILSYSTKKDNKKRPRETLFYDLGSYDITDKAFENYYLLNYINRYPGKFLLHRRDSFKNNFYTNQKDNQFSNLKSDSLFPENTGASLKKIKVAVANLKVKSEDILESILRKSNLSKDKEKRIIDILNSAEKEKANLLALPEVSIPFHWLPMLADESRRKQRVIVAGLEHLNINNIVYNFIVTILPYKTDQGISDSIIHIRLKNHYSPGEKHLIELYRRIVPVNAPYNYTLFRWRGLQFSSFNCFELADIEHRALFKSKVDFLIACEYNKDVNYFSNIVESVTRDVHCYFIQVNTSDYGDSRITQPTKSETQNILRLKGGENSTILTGMLDIASLREFQSHLYSETDQRYKPTPPDFDHKAAENRGKRRR